MANNTTNNVPTFIPASTYYNWEYTQEAPAKNKVEAAKNFLKKVTNNALQPLKVISKELTLDRKYMMNGDIGTGDGALAIYTEDDNGNVISITKKAEVLRKEKVNGKKTDDLNPEVFVSELMKKVQTVFSETFKDQIDAGTMKFENLKIKINLSSWARTALGTELKMIELLKKVPLQYPNIEVNVLSLQQEADLSKTAIKTYYEHCDQRLLKNHNIDPSKMLHWEGGQGSRQGLNGQGVDRAGAWANDQVCRGVSLKDIIRNDKAALELPSSLPKGTNIIPMMGLFGVALNNKEIVSLLGIKDEAKAESKTEDTKKPEDKADEALSQTRQWEAGLLPKSLNDVINALDAYVRKHDQLSEVTPAAIEKGDTQFKEREGSVPVALALSSLLAFREKFGDDFRILCVKEGSKFFDAKNNAITKDDVKASGSLGSAVQYFNNPSMTYRVKTLATSMFNKLLGRKQEGVLKAKTA